MNDKKTIGLTLIISGAIIYGSTLIASSIYTKTLINSNMGWNNSHGIFGTAIREIGTIPIIISIILSIIGIIFIMDKKINIKRYCKLFQFTIL